MNDPFIPPIDLESAVARVQAGDTEAYADVVMGCMGFLRGWVVANARHGIDPDEITHQAFISAYVRIDSYRPGSQFRAWLVTIAKHILLNEAKALRRRDARRRPYAEAGAMAAPIPIAEPDQDGELQERRMTALRACLGMLRPAARDLVTLRYELKLSVWEVAERLGRSPGAIAKSLSLIRRTLHGCIDRHLMDEHGA